MPEGRRCHVLWDTGQMHNLSVNIKVGARDCRDLCFFLGGGGIWVRGLRYLSVDGRRLPDWSANSSSGITSNPVAERGFVPAPVLTGCLLHHWVALVAMAVLWLRPGFLEVYSPSSVPPDSTLLDSCLAIVFQLGVIQH